MGSGPSLLAKEDLETYQLLTHFSRRTILHLHSRFLQMADPEAKRAQGAEVAVRQEVVVARLSEFRANPFAARLCRVFSENKEVMVFEEFLDMLSSLSLESPVEARAMWAFRTFDYDGDGMLGRKDVRRVVDAVTGTDMAALSSELREKVVSHVLE